MKRKFSKILGIGLTLSLLTSLLLTAAPVSALTQPSVTLNDYELSHTPVQYIILFTLGADLPEGDVITIDFPTGTDLTNVTNTEVLLSATSGIGSDAFADEAVGTVVKNDADGDVDVTGPTLIITIPNITPALDLNNEIGAGALIQVIVEDVINPSTPGGKTLDVSTSNETAVPSTTYTIVSVLPLDLPGIVQVFNADGWFIAQATGDWAIDAMIIAAGEDHTIEIGPGTYSTDVFTTADNGVTFVGVSGAELTIIVLDIAIVNDDITLDDFTIRGEMWISGDNVLLTDCVFEKDDSETEEILLIVSGDDGVIEDSTFDTTDGSVQDIGIAVSDEGLTISGNSFLVDEDDVAVGISTWNGADVTIVEDNTFTGSSGIGVGVKDGDTTISGNTFDGLANAIIVSGGYDDIFIMDNTIRNSTGVGSDPDSWGWGGPYDGVISIERAYQSHVVIISNEITDTHEDAYVLVVMRNAGDVWMLYNNITGSTLNVYSNSGSDLDATHNWWGDADGPASDSIVEDSSGDILTEAWLGGPVELGTAVVAVDWVWPADLDAKDEAGVTISADDEADVLGAAVYDGNPFTAPPYPALGDPVDVYVSELNNLVSGDEVTIKLYDAALTDDTVAYAWSELAGEWIAPDNQGVSTFGGYVWVIVSETTIPALEDLAGIPLVLVDAPAPPIVGTPIITTPDIGEKDVVLKPTLGWTSITDAIGYDFELADNEYFIVPMVKLVGDSRLATAFYAQVTELDYSTYYYWRVKAVSALTESEWSNGVFYTVAEPIPEPEPEPEVWMCSEGLTFDSREALEAHLATAEAHQVVEPADIIIEPPDIIVPLPAETPITPAWIYVIIGVGAVLVISVIVLIVRTRRVA